MMETEFEYVMRVVRKAESLGSRALPNGVKLVGRVPHVAPEAHLHLVFPPLTAADIEIVEKGIGKPLPHPLAALLRKTNGLDLFSSSLSFYGLRHSYSRSGDYSWQPFDIIMPNVHERPADLDSSLVLFGGYDWDGSLLATSNEYPEVFRCDRHNGKPLNEWPSLSTMILSEVDRLDALFDEKGRARDPDWPTTPPDNLNNFSVN